MYCLWDDPHVRFLRLIHGNGEMVLQKGQEKALNNMFLRTLKQYYERQLRMTRLTFNRPMVLTFNRPMVFGHQTYDDQVL